MDRRAVVRAALAAGIIAVAGLALATCSNPIDIVGAVTTEVMVANNKFLLVNDVGPAKNTTNVDPSAYVWIEFDRDLDLASIKPDTATIVSDTGTPVDWTWSYDSPTKTLNIYPVVLEMSTAYTATITGTLKGKDGSDLQTNYTWTFTTGIGPSGSVVVESSIGNTTYTGSLSVNLDLTYNADTDRARWSTDPSQLTNSPITGSNNWIPGLAVSPGGSSVGITLPDTADGTKTVYVQFWDSGPTRFTSIVAPPNDSIILDRTAPAAPTVSVNSGAAYAAASTPVTISAADPTSGLSQMEFSNDNSTWSSFEAFSNTKASWPLAAGADGARTVYVRVKDGAGNVSPSGLDGVTLDATAPTLSAFYAGGNTNPVSTPVPGVTLYTAATDAGSGVSEMQYYQYYSTGVYSSWMTYAQNKSWNLDDHAGTRTMWVRVRDAVGNTTSWVSDDIVLYARIVITYTQIYVSNDGDADLKGGVADPGEIAYYLGSNSTYFVTRVYPNTISRNHGTYITAAYLPQGSRTIYLDPTTGTQSLDAWIYDYDGSVSVYQYGTGSVIMTAPFTAGVTSGTISMLSVTGAAGTAYYTWDYQNP